MKLTEPRDALQLPDGTLNVVRPTAEGPVLENLRFNDNDVLEAARVLASGRFERLSSVDFKTKSEVFAVAVNEFDFRREFFEAFAT